MKVIRAVSYRLFATGERRGRSLLIRGGLYFAAVAGIGALLYKATPANFVNMLGLSQLETIAVLYTLTQFFVSLIFILMHSYLFGFMTRLYPLRLLPLRRAVLRSLYVLSALPVVLLASVICVASELKLFQNALPYGLLIAFMSGSLLLSIMLHVGIRVSSSKVFAWPQALSLIHAGLMLEVVQGFVLRTQSDSMFYLWETLVFAIVHVGLIVVSLLSPIRIEFALQTMFVPRLGRLTLLSDLFIRAFRSQRYVSALTLVIVLFVALSLYAYNRPGVVSFDGAVVVSLLLTGTMAQEIRGLSDKFYPLEAVYYGQIFRPLVSAWLTVLATLLVILAGMLLMERMFFEAALSVSRGYVIGAGMLFVAAGGVVASFVAPRKDDILSQIAATILYAGSIWVVFRALRSLYDGGDLAILLAACVATVGGFGICYVLEKLRWTKTIRGSYANLFR